MLSYYPAANRSRDDAGEQGQSADRRGRARRVLARALEQHNDPVRDHDVQAERGRMYRDEREQSSRSQRSQRRLLGLDLRPVAARTVGRACQERNHRNQRHDGGRSKRRAPLEGALEDRHDGERYAAHAKVDSAVDSLGQRRADHRAHVVAARDEHDAGSEPKHRTCGHAECERGGDQRDCVHRADQDDAADRDVAGAHAVDQPATRQLHGEVRHKHRCRQQADGCERHSVPVGDSVGYGADVGDLPADGHAGSRGSDCRRQPHSRLSAGPSGRLGVDGIGQLSGKCEQASVMLWRRGQLQADRKTSRVEWKR